MKLFKPTYTDRDGKKKKCQCWYLTFTDNRGARRRLPAFTNKRASEKAAERIEELLAGMQNPDLQRWLDNLPEKMRNSLIKFGLIDSHRIASHIGKPLAKHLSDFGESLIAKGNDWQRVVDYRIDGICRYLQGQLLIAKGNDIDSRGIFVRKYIE